MTKPAPPSYRTTNWRAYNAALKQRGSLLIWFDPETEWLAAPSGRRGRPTTFSNAAIQACLMLKALFGLPLRQTTGLVASPLRLAKLNWSVPDFSTLCRRQKDLTVTIPYQPSQGALHLLIDSTGIKAMGEGEWVTRKHGFKTTSVAQGSPRHRCGDAGDPSHRGRRQPCRRRSHAPEAAGADPARGADC